MLEEIALKKEIFKEIAKELKYAVILFLLVLVIFKIAFYRESFAVLLKTVLSLFWLFVLPGCFITLYWKYKLDFIERAVAGTGISAAIIGILSYYISLAGLNLRFHAIILPLIIILAGVIINLKKSDGQKEH